MDEKYLDRLPEERVDGNGNKNYHPENFPVVVKIKPGTAAEKSLRILLPEDRKRDSIGSVVEYALRLREEDGINREELRIQERVRTEMSNSYGLSVNGEAVKGREQILDFLQERETSAGKPYLEAEVIVASRQEGAFGNILN